MRCVYIKVCLNWTVSFQLGNDYATSSIQYLKLKEIIIQLTDKKNPDHALSRRNEGSIVEEQEFGIKKDIQQ